MPTNRFGITVPDHMVQQHQEHERHGTMQKWDYCKLDKFGQPEEVSCKLCGCKIVGTRDWGDPEVYRAKDEKNTLVVKQRTRIMPYDNYALILLKMNDGSRHLTPVCKACAPHLSQAPVTKLHDLYMSDLQSLAATCTNQRDIDVVGMMHKRKPTEVL